MAFRQKFIFLSFNGVKIPLRKKSSYSNIKLNYTSIIFIITLLCNNHVYAAQPDGFYDDFSHGIDPNRWILVNKQWGGNNGGVIAENIHWVPQSDHHLELIGHGNNYQGSIRGINGSKIRVGAAIATRGYYASGIFSVCAKTSPELGAVNALWLFHYTELTTSDSAYKSDEDPIRNSEIDWETPTDDGHDAEISYRYARTNAWGGQKPGDTHYFTQIIDLAPYNDGIDPSKDHLYHKYEIIWHSGNNLPNGTRAPGSVTWLFAHDCNSPGTVVNHLIGTKNGNDDVPYHAARFWLGIWFPVTHTLYRGKYTGWAGTPDFNTTSLNIKWVSITPFIGTDNRDVWVPETGAVP